MNNPLFYQCTVLDNKDPLMLGRVRARLLTDNYEDIIRSIQNPPWDESKDIWTNRDPFIFIPLLPYYLYQVPKIDELILIVYNNSDFKYQNQFYVQSLLSTPTSSNYEYYVASQKLTGIGTQYKNSLPIKNKDGTYPNNLPVGIFPEPGDNALLGRNSADVIVKENEVLIRAGKIQGTLQPNIMPAGNTQRSFIQLSKFDNEKVFQENKTYGDLKPANIMVKYLIEWVIINPENNQDKFTGTIYLYSLKENESVTSKNLQVDSQIEDLKTIFYSEDFTAIPMSEVITRINDFIREFNSKSSIKFVQLFPKINDQRFPVFFRPNNLTYSKMLSSTGITATNLSTIFNAIKLNLTAPERGYGLIYTKDKVGIPYDSKIYKVPIYKYNNVPTTFAGVGADKVFLLSHNSSIPGKGKINLDNTLYGIDNDKMVDELIPKTSSTVRGEELLDLLNKIVRFLITHTHAYPGLPPTPVTQDGSNSASIEADLRNAINNILNENIRIN